MNIKNFLTVIITALSIGSSFALTTYKTNVVCITGSTAGRVQVNEALDSLYNNGTNGWSRVSRLTNVNGNDIARLYAQTPQTNIVGRNTNIIFNYINLRWSGSESGIALLASTNDGLNCLPLNSTGTNLFTYYNVLNYTNVTSIAFSDVKQTFSKYYKRGTRDLLGGYFSNRTFDTLPAPTELMALNTVWIGSSNFPTNSATMTKEIAVELFNNGSCPLSRFTCNSGDNAKTVYLVGFTADSGTRIAALLTAGLPTTATIKQYRIQADQSVSLYPDETVNGLRLINGMSGYPEWTGPLYDGEKSVSIALSYLTDTNGTNFAVGYIKKDFYNPSNNVLMTFQGIDSDKTNIVYGKYSMWTAYNAYKRRSLNPKVCDPNLVNNVYDSLTAAIIASDKGSNNVSLSELMVKRPVDGGAISPK